MDILWPRWVARIGVTRATEACFLAADRQCTELPLLRLPRLVPEVVGCDPFVKAPARGVPADVMIVRTRPSVHGNRILKAFPNSKQDTEGRYELSSVRSSCTYP